MKIVMETRFITPDIRFLCKYLNKTKAILLNIKIVAKDSKITFTATNLEQSVSTTFDKFIVEEGEVCVDGKTFLNVLENFKNTAVQIATEENHVVVSNSELSLNVPSCDTTDFPPDMGIRSAVDPLKEPLIVWHDFIGTNHHELLAGLNQCMVSTDDSGYNPIHNGICFNFNNYISLTSTESHMLSKCDTTVMSSIEMQDMKVVVPSGAFKHLLKSKTPLKLGFSYVTMTINKVPEWFYLETGNIKMVSRLIDGRFPDYERVIPKSWTQDAFINADAFEKIVNSLYKISKDKYLYMEFTTDKMKLTINGQSMEMSVGYKYPEAKICFDAKYIIDYLKSLETNYLSFRWTTPSFPGTFVTENGLGTFIVMPCTL